MKIVFKNLTFMTIVGVLDYERVTPQRVIINTTIKYKQKKETFLDYQKIKELIKYTMKHKKFYLLEDAVKGISKTLKKSFPSILSIKIEIIKPDIFEDTQVGIKYSKKFKT